MQTSKDRLHKDMCMRDIFNNNIQSQGSKTLLHIIFWFIRCKAITQPKGLCELCPTSGSTGIKYVNSLPDCTRFICITQSVKRFELVLCMSNANDPECVILPAIGKTNKFINFSFRGNAWCNIRACIHFRNHVQWPFLAICNSIYDSISFSSIFWMSNIYTFIWKKIEPRRRRRYSIGFKIKFIIHKSKKKKKKNEKLWTRNTNTFDCI